jgi:predicted dehydrogenase
MTTPAIQFITLNPGHFHAALVQKEMYAQVAPLVHVYAPLGPDLVSHLQRVAAFNTRSVEPTRWELEVHAGAAALDRMLREKPGNVVVLAGRNAHKIDAIQAALQAGLHVLADKPWIISPRDLPRLEEALDLARDHRLIAYDIMTERHEITSLLVRELVRDEAVFGTIQAGSPEDPGVRLESMHYLKKLVAGMPLRRPAWFFDVHQQGEGLSDVGTHLVDQVMWFLFPDQAVDVRDISLLGARRWPTVLSRSDFQEVTGEADFPRVLHDQLEQDRLPYYCNTAVDYTLRGVHIKVAACWDYEAPEGASDSLLAVLRGSQARIEVRQGRAEHYQAEVYVHPNGALDLPKVRRALDQRLSTLQSRHPDVGLVDLGTHYRLSIPAALRTGHESHFGAVTHRFLRFVLGAEPMPAWEATNMLAKYTVSTRGVEQARRAAPRTSHLSSSGIR